MGENEEEPILRSINNNLKSFVTFINSTMHNVVLYWIDYQGRAVSYGVLASGTYIDIDTFVTHPWIFVDEETKERYTVNQKEIFFPEPWFAKYRGLREDQLPRRIERTCAFITIPLYTLRELSMRVISRYLSYDSQAFKLDIPRSLQYELARMLPKRADSAND